MTRRPHPALSALAVLAALTLAATSCGSDEDKKPAADPTPSVSLPTGDVEVPEGVELTKPGTTLAFGEPGAVAYEPNPQRSSVLSVTVDSVATGRMADFAAYQLDERTKSSTPYYVRATIENVGTGDLSRAAVPLLALDSRNTLIQPSSFNNTFERCPSTPLPAGFVAGRTVSTCLVYLVPAGGTLTAVSFRPLQAFEPITWEGAVKPVADKDTKKKNKKSKKKKASP